MCSDLTVGVHLDALDHCIATTSVLRMTLLCEVVQDILWEVGWKGNVQLEPKLSLIVSSIGGLNRRGGLVSGVRDINKAFLISF